LPTALFGKRFEPPYPSVLLILSFAVLR
jgi:hypothetical protein